MELLEKESEGRDEKIIACFEEAEKASRELFAILNDMVKG